MDRILADDFVLVTGVGKTYTKPDLLNEARSAHGVCSQSGWLALCVRPGVDSFAQDILRNRGMARRAK